ncbi:MAG: thioredoxin family protein [Planctomycetota bacterium]|jgi:HEAT repeat protein
MPCQRIFIGLIIFFCVLFVNPPEALAIEWVTNFDRGLDEAAERGAPVFIFFAQETCNISMTMYRGILRNSPAIDELAGDFVCILAYREVSPDAWKRASVYFLPQTFYTPTYVFADPKGNELLPGLSSEFMRMAFPEDRLAAAMKEVLAKVGKGIPRAGWTDVKRNLAMAQEAFEDGDATRSLKLLDGIIGKDSIPLLTERARRKREEMLDHAFLLRESAELDHTAAIRRLSDLARAYAGRPEGEEARKKLLEHGIKEPLPPRPDDEITENAEDVYRRAVSAALRGDAISARDELAFFLEASGEPEKYPRHVSLHKRLEERCRGAVGAGRMKVTKIRLKNTGELYWEIGITLTSLLARVDRLTIQYWALTEKDKVFAGYREFVNVPQGNRHQHAAYLPFIMIDTTTLPDGAVNGEVVTDVRLEIFVSNEVVARASLEADPGAQWWTRENVKPLSFMDESGWGWDSGTLRPSGEIGIVYGREEPEINEQGTQDEKPTLSERIKAAIAVLSQSVNPAEIGASWRELLEIGEAAVEPLKQALDPEGGEYAVNYAKILCDMQAVEAIPEILALLGSKDSFIRSEVPAGLIRFGDARIVPVERLIKQLDDEFMWPRCSAALTLGYLRDEKGVGPLIGRLGKEPDSTARAEIIAALTRITAADFGLDGDRLVSEQKEACEKLASWWKAHSVEKRENWMIEGLKKAGYDLPGPGKIAGGRVSAEVEESLRSAALDKRWWISFAALRFLAGLSNPESIPTFLEVLRKSERDDLRYAASLGIRAVAHRDSLEDVISAAEDNGRLVEDMLGVLENLFGIYSMPSTDSEDPAERMAPWRDWFEENEFYIYRPEGSPRFLLNEKAKEEATLVDPVTGKPEE